MRTMAKIGYSAQDVDEETTARAIGRELPISPKKAVELCRALRGKSIEDAQKITNQQIAQELSLPPVKIHCSVLAEDAIKAAIEDYRKKRSGGNDGG